MHIQTTSLENNQVMQGDKIWRSARTWPLPRGRDLHGLTLMHTTQIRLALSLHGTELPKKNYMVQSKTKAQHLV